MPNGMVIQNLDNTHFFKGFLYGTIDAAGETADGIPFGALQSISLQHEWGIAELRGPESLAPLGVGITEENLTGSARQGVLLPSQLKMMLGGTVVHSGGRTTYTKKVNEEPVPFHLHLINPDDGSGIEALLYRCLATNTPLIDGADNRAFVMQGLDFKVYGKVLDGDTEATLFKMIFPGNLTTSNVGQPGNTNSNDVPDTLDPD
jgi:hypothetical protein